MAALSAFTQSGTTVSVTPTTTTGALALTIPGWAGGSAVRVKNLTDVTVFINFGISTVTAVLTTSMPIGTGDTEVFQIGPAVTHVAHIITTGVATGKIYFTPGEGI